MLLCNENSSLVGSGVSENLHLKNRSAFHGSTMATEDFIAPSSWPDKKFIPYPSGWRTERRHVSKVAAQQVHSPRSVGSFLSRSCFAGASTMHRGAAPMPAWAPFGPTTETRPTTKYANASHKPPQQVHFSEAREPSRAAAKIHREMHPHVRRSFVTWTPEKSDGGQLSHVANADSFC